MRPTGLPIHMKASSRSLLAVIRRVVPIALGLTLILGACSRNESAPGIGKSLVGEANGATNKGTSEPRKIAATVDDQFIYEDELKPAIQGGIDRAIALDRAINRLVTARNAKARYASEAQQAIDTATREILSQLYLQKTTQRLSDAVTEQDIKSWYDRKITVDDYREYLATYVLTASAEEANSTAADANRGDKKTLARFKSVADQGDQWLKARDFPYGLGQVISRMKPGEISKPIALRNGWFVLMLKDRRERPPPTLDSVKTEIRNILVSEALVKDINEIRQQARIELK